MQKDLNARIEHIGKNIDRLQLYAKQIRRNTVKSREWLMKFFVDDPLYYDKIRDNAGDRAVDF